MLRTFAALLTLAFVSASLPARADTYNVFFGEKQKEKSRNRWSLAEWLDQRDRMRMMDLWLALHSPSPYEFYVGGAYKTGKNQSGGYYGGWDVYFAAYAYLFGMELQRNMSNYEPRWTGLVDFRAFGFHNQGTNLTFQGGVKNETRGGTSLWNPLVGVSLTLYFAQNFGVEGLYRHAFAGSSGLTNSTDRYEGGAFIDFSFVRVYGDYFAEIEAGAPDRSTSGVQLGTRLYF